MHFIHAGIHLFLKCSLQAQQESWTYQFGTSVTEHVNAVETLGDDIVVAGFTFGSLDGNSNAGSFDIFVMKLDSSGSKLEPLLVTMRGLFRLSPAQAIFL